MKINSSAKVGRKRSKMSVRVNWSFSLGFEAIIFFLVLHTSQGVRKKENLSFGSVLSD